MYNHLNNLYVYAALLDHKVKLERSEKLVRYRVMQQARAGLLRQGVALMGKLMVRSGQVLERFAQPASVPVVDDNYA